MIEPAFFSSTFLAIKEKKIVNESKKWIIRAFMQYYFFKSLSHITALLTDVCEDP